MVPLQPHQQQYADHPAEVHASLQDPYRAVKMLAAGAIAGAVSRTATAPIDRVKMLLQVQDSSALSIKGAFRQMAAESTCSISTLHPDSQAAGELVSMHQYSGIWLDLGLRTRQALPARHQLPR